MKRSMACSCLLALCAALWTPEVGAQGIIDSSAVASEAQRFELGVGKSKVIDLTTSFPEIIREGAGSIEDFGAER